MWDSPSDSDRSDLRQRLEAVRSALGRQGIDLRLDGDIANLRIDGVELERRWRWVTPSHSQRGPDWARSDGGWLLLADRVSPSRADAARARGDWFADTLGRVHIRAPGVVIDVRDRPVSVGRPVGPESRQDRLYVSPARAHNAMSPKRAQVVCCLLDEPALVSAGLRTIAARSGVSIGVVQQVLNDLDARHYLRHGGTSLNRVDELLDQWTAAFSSGLGSRLEIARFSGDAVQLGAWVNAGHVVYLSGEAASDELHGTDATIYVAEFDTRAAIASRWSRKGDRPNIIVRQQFWSDVDREPGVYNALLPLRLADLLVTDEPRLRLAARPLREEILDRHRQ